MSETKENRVPAKVADWALELLRDYQHEIRRKTGEMRTLGSLIDEAIKQMVKTDPVSNESEGTESSSSPEMELWKLYLERNPQSAYRMIGQMEFQLDTTLEKLTNGKTKGNKSRRTA